MTREEYMKAAEDVIYLASCAVKRVSADPVRVKGMDLTSLYQVSAFHLLTGIVGYALESVGVHDPAFTQAKGKAIRKVALMDAEKNALFACLDEAGIWYMPLKGSVLKALYPSIGMRQMADHDILIDASRAADVRAIMESLGFTTEHFGSSNHDVYHKEPVCNFEIHTALFGPGHDEKLYAYYRDVEKKLIAGTGCEKHFTPEDFYLYMTAHEYKHYSGGGTGLRSLLDTYVYLQKETLDMEYVAAEAEKLGIAAFEAANRSLALHLFNDEKMSEEDQEMLEYILLSGTYGTVTHRIRNTMKKRNWTKMQYALHRFFVPVSRKNPDYAVYAGAYPLFYKYKMLLPLLPFYRLIRAMKGKRFMTEAKAIMDVK